MNVSTELCPMCKTGDLNLTFILSSYSTEICVRLHCDVCQAVFENLEMCIRIKKE